MDQTTGQQAVAGDISPLQWHNRALMISGWSFVAADVAAWLSSLAIIFVVRTAIWGLSPVFWALWATGVIWLIFRWASGLLPPTGLPQPEVLRRSVRTTAAAALLHIVLLA